MEKYFTSMGSMIMVLSIDFEVKVIKNTLKSFYQLITTHDIRYDINE